MAYFPRGEAHIPMTAPKTLNPTSLSRVSFCGEWKKRKEVPKGTKRMERKEAWKEERSKVSLPLNP